MAQTPPATADPRQIVLRSADRDQADLEIRKDYTYLIQTEQRNLDSSGKVTKTETRTQEVLILYGRPYDRLIAKDGKPLPPDQDRKERDKMDKEVARRAKESPKEKEKRAREESANLEQLKDVLREVADAFDFRIVGEEALEGFATWVIQAEPKPGYRPRSKRTRLLPSFRGKVWITKDGYRWVKVEAEVIRGISVGLVLARLNPGTTLAFEQQRVQGEIWMPRQVRSRVNAKLALLKNFNLDVLVTYSNYRKFQSDSRIVETSEIPATPPQ
jgi:hypothetical protein